MSGLIAIDHRVSTAAVAGHRAAEDKPASEWSARRRLGFLSICVAVSWAAVLTPLFLVF